MARRKGRTDPEAPAPRFVPGMRILDALEADPRVKDILLSFDLPCFRCVVAEHETLAEGCHPLGLDIEAVLVRLNAL